MVRFKKDGKIMDVCSELQASAFKKNGWVSIDIEHMSTEAGEARTSEDARMENPPAKRGRKPTASK